MSTATPAVRPLHPSQATDDWKPVHEQIMAIGRGIASHQRELCWWLARAKELGVHTVCGFASLFEYADRHVGLNRRQTEERLRVGRCLEGLPALDGAFGEGAIAWSKVRELSRIATADTEHDWLNWSDGRTSREVEHAVATRKRGDRPSDPGDASRLKHRLSFEVSAETMAVFRALEQQVKQDLGGDADDDSVLLEIARRGLGGPKDGAPSYQIAVARCDECGSHTIDAAGRRHSVDAEIGAMASCDAQMIGQVDECPHVGAETGNPARTQKRATRSIPSSIRRKVLRRHSGRCAVPGCQNHRFLDVHHSKPRQDGGDHDPDLLLPLCGAHHRAAHRCQLIIKGDASHGFEFYHADGTQYGSVVFLDELSAAAEVAQKLVDMNFTLRRSHELVRRAREKTPHRDDPEALLAEALRQTRMHTGE